MRKPAASIAELTAPVRLRRVTSGFSMEKVRSRAMRAVSHCQGKRRAYSGELQERQGGMIEVTSEGGSDPLRFTVLVREGRGETRHAVTLAAADYSRLGKGATPE